MGPPETLIVGSMIASNFPIFFRAGRQATHVPNLSQPPFSASLVAKWFIRHAQNRHDQDLDNLKLQKLLFLAHSRTLSEFDVPLVVERIEAWRHGPVVQTVYREFREFDERPIDLELAVDGPWDHLPSPFVGVLEDTWDRFGAFSGWRLRDLTHEVGPWRAHFKPDVKNIAIPNEEIGLAWPVFQTYGAAPLPANSDLLDEARSRLRRVAEENPLGTRMGDPRDLVRQLDATEELRREAARLLG